MTDKEKAQIKNIIEHSKRKANDTPLTFYDIFTEKQIQYIKNLSIPVFIGGGINEKKAKEIINLLKPEGIDVSRSLKNSKNVISSKKLKNFLKQVTVV